MAKVRRSAPRSVPRSGMDDVLDRLRAACFALPGTTEKLSHGTPAFFVRGKMFAMFADDVHGDGRVGVWCKSTREEQERRVAEAPARYFVPPYVGVNGWVGVRLDEESADWDELAIVIEEAWLLAAPATAHADPVRPPPHQPPLPKTDPATARAARERMEKICAALPESTVEHAKRHAVFRVGGKAKKVYAYFLDNHDRDGIVSACFKCAPNEQQRLIARDPKTFYFPKYLGARGWVGYRLDAGRVDWKDLAARLAGSHDAVAPQRARARVRRKA